MSVIRMARELRQLSQRDLADRTNVTKSQIARLESDQIDRVALRDARLVCDELDLALESLLPPQTMAQNSDLKERWVGLMASHLMHRQSWRELPAALSRCTESLRCYRPDVSGMSVILTDENLPNQKGRLRRRFKQFYGGMSVRERAMHHLKLDEDFGELRQKIIDIEPGTGVSEVVTSSNFVEWLPSWRPLWATHHHSEYGMFSLFHRADPEEIGGALQVAARCVTVIDQAIETMHALGCTEQDASIRDHEHRLRGIEAQLNGVAAPADDVRAEERAPGNGSPDERDPSWRQRTDVISLG